MKPKSIAIVGAAETTELGRIPELSQIGLHAAAALNAMKDAGPGPKAIDGIATAGETPTTVPHHPGLCPTAVDATAGARLTHQDLPAGRSLPPLV